MNNAVNTASNPKFSIILPVYNTEMYISGCLSSILKQSFTNFEVICVNDGSTDKSRQILESFAKINDNIIIINQAQSGVSASRNLGLEFSRGEYSLFVDSDDYLHPKTLEVLNKYFDEYNTDVICFAYKKTGLCFGEHIFDELCLDNIKPVFVDPLEYLKQICKSENYVWSKAIRTSIAKKESFPVGYVLGEDSYYSNLILSNVNKVLYLDIPLYCYYKRDGSATNRNYDVKMFQIVDLYRKLVKLFLGKGNTDWSDYALDMLYRNIFIGRFLSLYTPEYEEINKLSKKIGKDHIKFLLKSDLSVKNKLKNLTFFFFPEIYRFIRIKMDPTLKGFERLKKQHYNGTINNPSM